jgi:MazG family protein
MILSNDFQTNTLETIPNLPEVSLGTLTALQQVIAVVTRLRDPNQGCPWDLKQTHSSLKPYLLEESYETLAAIDSGVPEHLCEELGDVLLQVLLHAQIAQDNGTFDLAQVAKMLSQKLIRRHPHVFAKALIPEAAHDAEQVTQQWELIKQQEKTQTQSNEPLAPSVLSGISRAQPALSRAQAISAKAVKAGFAWPDTQSLWQCVMSEAEEVKAELDAQTEKDCRQEQLEDELGDWLFALVSLANHVKVHPEVALTRATDKFERRFKAMESLVSQQHPEKALRDLSFEAWDVLWRQAKQATAVNV